MSLPVESPPRPIEKLAYWLAVGLGLGKMPVAPGTLGSLGALVVGYFLLRCGGWPLLGGATLAVIFIGIWASNIHQKLSGVHDQGEVVIDEVAGQWIAILPLAVLSPIGHAWADFLSAFVFFRIFDIIKPWPINRLDRGLKGGLGVMMDDIVAGVFAALLLAFGSLAQ